MEEDDDVRGELRQELEKELDEEYSNKISFIQSNAEDGDMFLVIQIQSINKEKQTLKKKLDDAERERDHLTQCMTILQVCTLGLHTGQQPVSGDVCDYVLLLRKELLGSKDSVPKVRKGYMQTVSSRFRIRECQKSGS